MDFLELCFSNWFPTPNIVAFTGYNFLSRVTYLNYFVTIYLYIISNKDLSNKPIMKSETISPPLPELSSAFDICYPCRKVSRIVAITDLLPLQTRVILSVEIFITTCIFFFSEPILQKPTLIYNARGKNYKVKHWLRLICRLAQYASFHSICAGKKAGCQNKCLKKEGDRAKNWYLLDKIKYFSFDTLIYRYV